MKSYSFKKGHIWELLPMQIEIIRKQRIEFAKKVVKTAWVWFSSILSLIVTVITIATAFKKDAQLYDTVSLLGINISLPTLMVCVFFVSVLASVYIHWPRIMAISSTPNVDVIIECCDLLKQEGLKVIHTTDTFDMESVMPGSLVDQFVKYCNDASFDLKKAIEAGLEGKEPTTAMPGDKQNRYKLGTVCDIRIETNKTKEVEKKIDFYGLVAFTHIDYKTRTVKLSIEEYKQFLKEMWRNLADPRVKTKDDLINVAVMGNRFLDFPLSYNVTQKIGYMLEAFFEVAKEKKCCRTLRICIGKDDTADIDFANIDAIIKYVEGRPKQIK